MNDKNNMKFADERKDIEDSKKMGKDWFRSKKIEIEKLENKCALMATENNRLERLIKQRKEGDMTIKLGYKIIMLTMEIERLLKEKEGGKIYYEDIENSEKINRGGIRAENETLKAKLRVFEKIKEREEHELSGYYDKKKEDWNEKYDGFEETRKRDFGNIETQVIKNYSDDNEDFEVDFGHKEHEKRAMRKEKKEKEKLLKSKLNVDGLIEENNELQRKIEILENNLLAKKEFDFGKQIVMLSTENSRLNEEVKNLREKLVGGEIGEKGIFHSSTAPISSDINSNQMTLAENEMMKVKLRAIEKMRDREREDLKGYYDKKMGEWKYKFASFDDIKKESEIMEKIKSPIKEQILTESGSVQISKPLMFRKKEEEENYKQSSEIDYHYLPPIEKERVLNELQLENQFLKERVFELEKIPLEERFNRPLDEVMKENLLLKDSVKRLELENKYLNKKLELLDKNGVQSQYIQRFKDKADYLSGIKQQEGKNSSPEKRVQTLNYDDDFTEIHGSKLSLPKERDREIQPGASQFQFDQDKDFSNKKGQGINIIEGKFVKTEKKIDEDGDNKDEFLYSFRDEKPNLFESLHPYGEFIPAKEEGKDKYEEEKISYWERSADKYDENSNLKTAEKFSGKKSQQIYGTDEKKDDKEIYKTADKKSMIEEKSHIFKSPEMHLKPNLYKKAGAGRPIHPQIDPEFKGKDYPRKKDSIQNMLVKDIDDKSEVIEYLKNKIAELQDENIVMKMKLEKVDSNFDFEKKIMDLEKIVEEMKNENNYLKKDEKNIGADPSHYWKPQVFKQQSGSINYPDEKVNLQLEIQSLKERLKESEKDINYWQKQYKNF